MRPLPHPSEPYAMSAIPTRASSATSAPVIFVSHGAPTFAIEPGELGPRLQSLGQDLTGVQAIMVVSPHWQSEGVKVMSTLQPETMYDFGGFSSKLYDITYPAPGAPALAQEAARLLSDAGFATTLDDRRGLDHGAWVPLVYLAPQATLPVFQVSMPYSLTTQEAYALGQALAPLREQGVLVMASGSMTHNLREFRMGETRIAPYAQEFADWVRDAVQTNAVDALVHYRAKAPHAERAHPTEEHFLPLLVALGANAGGNVAQLLDGGVTHGVLSMDSFAWGI
jgi:4,5-DOPA dioxygenase extradiol